MISRLKRLKALERFQKSDYNQRNRGETLCETQFKACKTVHTITNKEKILQYVSNELQTKYLNNASTYNKKEYLENNIRRKLSDQQESIRYSTIFARTVYSVKDMKRGKSPGSNGFTSDFFRHFWALLGIFLFRAFKEGVENNNVILSHRQSIVTLIPKEGKPRDSIKGWRPISLHNVDFKNYICSHRE